MALVLKTSDVKASVGSNPTTSVEGEGLHNESGSSYPTHLRCVAQLGSAFALGAKGRRFESCHADVKYKCHCFFNMPEPENDIYKEANDFTSECFQEIIDVLDNFIKDPLVKEQVFKEMNDDFKQVLGGNIRV